MASFRLPVALRPALILIANLGDAAVQELVRLLERNPRVLISRNDAINAARAMSSISPDDGESIIEAVVSLLYFKGSNDKSTAEVLKDIAPSFARTDPKAPPLSPELAARLEANLAKVLDVAVQVRHAKAISLATDCNALFTETRILSDLRPVFSESISNAPPAAVILHTLRIGYAQEGEEHQFFVTLDSNDLKQVQECVNRALEKDKTLRSFLDRSKMPTIETS